MADLALDDDNGILGDSHGRFTWPGGVNLGKPRFDETFESRVRIVDPTPQLGAFPGMALSARRLDVLPPAISVNAGSTHCDREPYDSELASVQARVDLYSMSRWSSTSRPASII